MLSKDPAVPLNGRERLAPPRQSAIASTRRVLVAAIVLFTMTIGTNARAATITVDSLADTGAPGICVLRDAITAANTMNAKDGCAAGTGSDSIKFGVSGTITLASELPAIVGNLTITGPKARATPGITISGKCLNPLNCNLQKMAVHSGAQRSSLCGF
jgi:hypothetical protein